ncbi:MAG TPA: DUF983 domain-containing protein [Pricia sp.]|uniref:DUF983 domain-containing protein n=1 Tax=Pricia antarctica TaxID=641691 RepID=A0A831QQR5_9FLAO|nr:DUF983 domain-containing protein [Pricia sp.]HEA23154.1 DUF983 domain-containing protein [Pricia antarctica]
MQKGTLLYSILKLKCPRCRTGDLFINPGLFVFSRILDMPDRCPHCNQDFKFEPGYYTAALWISYPILLLLFVPLTILGFTLADFSFFFKLVYPVLILISLFLQIPLMRMARAILLAMTIDYAIKS